MMSIVYIDEPAHSNKERRKLKQVVSHTEENALILRQNNLTFLLIFSIYFRLKKIIHYIYIPEVIFFLRNKWESKAMALKHKHMRAFFMTNTLLLSTAYLQHLSYLSPSLCGPLDFFFTNKT